MIDRSEVLSVAAELSLSPDVVEKDYVLGWLLAGIYAHEDLAPVWIFKGGTCLKKCYFETYRFSEDLDFTLINPSHLDADLLGHAFREIAAWLYEETGIEIPADELRFKVYTNRRGGLSVEAGLQFLDLPALLFEPLQQLIVVGRVRRTGGEGEGRASADEVLADTLKPIA